MNQHDEGHKRAHEMIGEDELRRLFAPRKPDAERFAAGIAERLQSPDKSGRPPTAGRLSLLERAAGLRPGFPDGGFLAKSWATIFSLPALLLFGAFAMFFRSNRRVDEAIRDGSANSPKPIRYSEAIFVRPIGTVILRSFLPTIGSLLALGLMALGLLYGGSAVLNTATLVILVSMGVLTFQLGQFARSRDVSVATVGKFVLGLQMMALFGCVLWVQISGVFDGDSSLGYGATGWVMAAGIFATSTAMLIFARTWFSSIAAIVILVMLPSAIVFGRPDNSATAIRERVVALDLQTDKLGGWEAAAAMVHTLEVCGEAPVELPAVRERVERAIEAESEVHSVIWTAAGRMGLIDDEHWRLLAKPRMNAYRLEQLLEQEGPLRLRSYDGYLLSILLATRDLTEQQRDHLVARIDASWPDPEAEIPIHNLDYALLCVRWLDRLDRDDIIDARVEQLHRLLRQHWVSESQAARFSFPGGFTRLPNRLPPSADINGTSTAIALIERVGAPPEVPLRHVRAFLRHQTRFSLMMAAAGTESILAMQARADHYLLTESIGLPARGILGTLLGERMFIAALLLALLSLRAVLLAHRSSQPAAPGALP